MPMDKIETISPAGSAKTNHEGVPVLDGLAGTHIHSRSANEGVAYDVEQSKRGVKTLVKSRTTNAPVKVGDCIKNRFQLLNVLGVGGMGVVYRARDLRQKELGEKNPDVAFKVLNEKLSNHKAALVALQQEYKRCQHLSHPNIVNVFDFDREGRVVYMTMELLQGTPLDRLVNDPSFTGRSYHDVLPWIQSVCDALDYAHANQVIHSDLKPSNIFLINKHQAKVLDFGIGRVMESVQSQEMAQVKGMSALTPAYASLGMLNEKAPSPVDDLYALAIVIYQLLSGKHPYNRSDANVVLNRGFVPERPDNLPNHAWKILKKALHPLESETLSIREFIQAFAPQPKRNYTGWIVAGVVAAIVGMAVSGYFYTTNKRTTALLAALQSGDKVTIDYALLQLQELEAAPERGVLLQQSRQALIDYAQRQISFYIAEKNWPSAFAIVEQFTSLYPDSQALSDMQRRVMHYYDSHQNSHQNSQ